MGCLGTKNQNKKPVSLWGSECGSPGFSHFCWATSAPRTSFAFAAVFGGWQPWKPQLQLRTQGFRDGLTDLRSHSKSGLGTEQTLGSSPTLGPKCCLRSVPGGLAGLVWDGTSFYFQSQDRVTRLAF
jgi:hypothetical protein